MSEFIQCVGCAANIHQTALACPRCGAPQVATQGQASSAPRAKAPWFRRRWFVLLCLVTVTPIASLLAMTGDVHYVGKDGKPTVYSKEIKKGLMIATLPWLILTFGGNSSATALAGVGLLFFAVLLAFKK